MEYYIYYVSSHLEIETHCVKSIYTLDDFSLGSLITISKSQTQEAQNNSEYAHYLSHSPLLILYSLEW